MIHPSYVEMIDKINEEQDREDAPLVTSRYSVVLATARRARQLVSGAEPYVKEADRYGKPRKPLSVAVDEFYEDKVHIVRRADSPEAAEDLTESEEQSVPAEAAESVPDDADDLTEETKADRPSDSEASAGEEAAGE